MPPDGQDANGRCPVVGLDPAARCNMFKLLPVSSRAVRKKNKVIAPSAAARMLRPRRCTPGTQWGRMRPAGDPASGLLSDWCTAASPIRAPLGQGSAQGLASLLATGRTLQALTRAAQQAAMDPVRIPRQNSPRRTQPPPRNPPLAAA